MDKRWESEDEIHVSMQRMAKRKGQRAAKTSRLFDSDLISMPWF